MSINCWGGRDGGGGDYNVLTLFYRCITARQQKMHHMQQEFQVLTA